MSFDFNKAASLCINLEIRPFQIGRTQSPRGYTYSEPPYFLNDIGFGYSNTFKYTPENKSYSVYRNGSANMITSTEDLSICNPGTYITQSQVSSVYNVSSSSPMKVSNPLVIDNNAYFGCADGTISELPITGNPPSLGTPQYYSVESGDMSFAICKGTTDTEIVYAYFDGTNHQLKRVDISSSPYTPVLIESFTNSFSDLPYDSLFRKDTLVSFTHSSLGFIICYMDYVNSDILVYDQNYGQIIKYNVPYQWTYLKVSPDSKDLILWSDGLNGVANLGRFSMSSGPTYSFSSVTSYEVRDFDFGYGYGTSPSNIYIISSNILNVWTVESGKPSTTDIFTFNYSLSNFDLNYLLTDYKYDQSETNYLFFGCGMFGTPSATASGTMRNMYFSTYSATASFNQGVSMAVNCPTYDYTLGINCMRVIDGASSSKAPKGHILQYYNDGNVVGIFNTSAGKLTEKISTLNANFNTPTTEGCKNFTIEKFREDDVYLIVDQDIGEFVIVYWT